MNFWSRVKRDGKRTKRITEVTQDLAKRLDTLEQTVGKRLEVLERLAEERAHRKDKE